MTRPTLDEIRTEDGTLPPVAYPGGYPLIYVDGLDEDVCGWCAAEDDSKLVDWFIYYEGPDRFCVSCNKPIESAYGDPEAKDYKKPYMSVDSNFRVTIHDGRNDEVS